MLYVRKRLKSNYDWFGFPMDWTRKKHFRPDRLGHVAHKSEAKTKQK